MSTLEELRTDLIYHSEALEGSPLTREEIEEIIQGEEMALIADLRDTEFEHQPGACYIQGHWGDTWINQFAGAGPSQAKFSFKALAVDGIIYIPDPGYAIRTPKSQRDYAHYPMARAHIQPPVSAIRSL
jgi:hypothetical protein